MDDRDRRYVDVSESAIVVIMLVALGAYLLWSFFESWWPSIRALR